MAKKARNKSKSFISALSKQRPNRKNRKRSIKQQQLIKQIKSFSLKLALLCFASYIFHGLWNEFVNYTISANTNDYIVLANKPVDQLDLDAKNEISSMYFSNDRKSLATIAKNIQNKYGYSLVQIYITQDKKVNLLLERHSPVFKLTEKNETCLSDKGVVYQGCQSTNLPLFSGLFAINPSIQFDSSGRYELDKVQKEISAKALSLISLIHTIPDVNISKVLYNEFDGFKIESQDNLNVLFGHIDFKSKIMKLKKIITKDNQLLKNSKIDLDYEGKLFLSKSGENKEKL